MLPQPEYYEPMNINSSIDNFLKSLLWLWLPFYAFFELIHALGERANKK